MSRNFPGKLGRDWGCRWRQGERLAAATRQDEPQSLFGNAIGDCICTIPGGNCSNAQFVVRQQIKRRSETVDSTAMAHHAVLVKIAHDKAKTKDAATRIGQLRPPHFIESGRLQDLSILRFAVSEKHTCKLPEICNR